MINNQPIGQFDPHRGSQRSDPTSLFEVVQAGPVSTGPTFQSADPALAIGAPFDGSPERSLVFDLLPGNARSALARDHHVSDPAVGQRLIDRGLAVPAVGGHRPRHPPRPG